MDLCFCHWCTEWFRRATAVGRCDILARHSFWGRFGQLEWAPAERTRTYGADPVFGRRGLVQHQELVTVFFPWAMLALLANQLQRHVFVMTLHCSEFPYVTLSKRTGFLCTFWWSNATERVCSSTRLRSAALTSVCASVSATGKRQYAGSPQFAADIRCGVRLVSSFVTLLRLVGEIELLHFLGSEFKA